LTILASNDGGSTKGERLVAEALEVGELW